MRRGNLFWGLVILALGLLLLLSTSGILPANINVWAIFWPLVLIFLGVWFLVGPIVYRRRAEHFEELSIPLEGATEARVRLKHGAGKLIVDSLAEQDMLLSGTFYGGVESSVVREGSYLKAKLKLPAQYITLPSMGGFPDLTWTVKLNPLLPIRLDVESGASSTELHLKDLKIKELHIDTGASSTEIEMPSRAGFTQTYIESGAASVKISVPADVAAIIHVQSALAGITIDTNRFPQAGTFYASPGYETAENKVEIHIKTGVGSVDIR